jgi:hypothetical protein
MSYAGLLDQRVTILRGAVTARTAAGEEIRSFTQVAANVPVSIQATKTIGGGGRSRYADPGLVQTAHWFGWARPGQDVQIADRVVHARYGTLEVLEQPELIRGRVLEFRLKRLIVADAP